MSILVTCRCGTQHHRPDNEAGTAFTCTACASQLQVPGVARFTVPEDLDVETTTGPARHAVALDGAPLTPLPPLAGLDPLDIESTLRRGGPLDAIPAQSATTAAAPVAPGQELAVGHLLDDRYVVTKLLGRGSGGIVYKVTERVTQVEYAVKVLAPSIANDPQAVKELWMEVAAAADLAHPRLLKVNHLADSGPLKYIVMQYVEGENLELYRQRQRGRITLQEFRSLAPQILEGLDYLHEQGLVHRDVKPQNVMRTPAGEIKITDYGIARSLKHQRADQDLATAPVGTLCYMAPEQLQLGAEPDGRADIYAVGMMFHRLLCGEFPFAGTDPATIRHWHTDPLHKIHDLGSSELNRIITKAVAVAPAERYANCRALLADLQRLGLGTAPYVAAPVTAAVVERSPIEALLELTRLTKLQLEKRIGEIYFDFNYPRVWKHREGTYELPRKQGAAAFKNVFTPKVHPADELAEALAAATARGTQVDPRLQHNVEILLTTATAAAKSPLNVIVLRVAGVLGALGTALVAMVGTGLLFESGEAALVGLVYGGLGGCLLALWPFAVARQRKLADDLLYRLKKPQTADMY